MADVSEHPDYARLDAAGQRSIEWKAQLLHNLASIQDRKTLMELVVAGLSQAHEDGILASADYVEQIRASTPHPQMRYALNIAAKGLREWSALNVADENRRLAGTDPNPTA